MAEEPKEQPLMQRQNRKDIQHNIVSVDAQFNK